VPPSVAHDTEASVSMGRRLWAHVDRPNLFVKIPATPEGIPAIRQLLVEGVNVNITLLFSLQAYQQVLAAYVDALTERARRNLPLTTRSVASFFVSRIDTAVDAELDKLSGGEVASLHGMAAIANARCARELYARAVQQDGFRSLSEKGAAPQRLLWASTSTKNPAYRDVMYVEALVGSETINTMPRRTLEAFAEHGQVVPDAVDRDWDAAHRTLDRLSAHGIDMGGITRRLLDDGLRIFQDSYDEALAVIGHELDRLGRR
jgi:transaldolase / glucose-6-phosphate isomerase